MDAVIAISIVNSYVNSCVDFDDNAVNDFDCDYVIATAIVNIVVVCGYYVAIVISIVIVRGVRIVCSLSSRACDCCDDCCDYHCDHDYDRDYGY